MPSKKRRAAPRPRTPRTGGAPPGPGGLPQAFLIWPPIYPSDPGPLTRALHEASRTRQNAAPPALPCGCRSEEQHAQEDGRQRALVTRVLKALRARRSVQYIDPEFPFMIGHLNRVSTYFRWLRAHAPREYRSYVQRYAEAHEAVWAKLPCQRGVLPLLADTVPGLLRRAPVPPRSGKGGALRDPQVQERNDVIRAMRGAGQSDRAIAQELGRRGFPVPPKWPWPTWTEAQRDPRGRRRVQQLFSQIVTRGT